MSEQGKPGEAVMPREQPMGLTIKAYALCCPDGKPCRVIPENLFWTKGAARLAARGLYKGHQVVPLTGSVPVSGKRGNPRGGKGAR